MTKAELIRDVGGDYYAGAVEAFLEDRYYGLAEDDLDDYLDQEFDDSFIGYYRGMDEDDAIGDYLFEFHDSCGAIPDHLRSYIDTIAMGRDARYGGEISAHRVDYGEYALFWNI